MITSSGSSALTINSVSVAGAGFAVFGPSFPATLNPGQTLTIEVRFAPTAATPANGTIVISTSSAGNSTTTVTLTGAGAESPIPQLTVSPSSLDFGNVMLNATSTRNLTLTSSGNTALKVNSVSVAGAGFAIMGATFPLSLDAGQSVTLQVSFGPLVAGSASGTITISSNSASSDTAMVAISGTGTQSATPSLTLSASSLDFGSVSLNTNSTRTLTLTSVGSAALTVDSVTISGSGFAISGGRFPATLDPGQSVTLQVSFDPTVAGAAATGTISISSNSSMGATSTVTLSGKGTVAASPVLTLSAASLSFGSVTVNTTSSKTLTLTSSGTAALTINSVNVAGNGFAISGTALPATLTPGQSVTLQVSFDPTIPGVAAGTITISSNSLPVGITSVALSGTGTVAPTPQLTMSASHLDFGNVNLNTTATKTLTVTSSGTAALTVTSVALSGTGFEISASPFPATLNPGQSKTLQVGFDPTLAGAATGLITISSNASTGTSDTVTLSGSGVADPVLSLSTTSLSFGDDPIGSALTLSVTLTSTGSSPVTVSGAAITGAGFTFSGATFPVMLNTGVAITIQVQFKPTMAGLASGTLTFTSNSRTGNLIAVTLAGNGTNTSHKVTLSWVAPANSPVEVTGYDIYREAGSFSSFELLNSSTATTYVDLQVSATTSYTYYVTSVDAAGAESAPSNEVTVTVP